jgi:hypothetical protein
MVRQEILCDWRSAVLRARVSDDEGISASRQGNYWLGQILAGDPALAFDWLRARISDPEPLGDLAQDRLSALDVAEGSPFTVAIRCLDRDQRSLLLDELQVNPRLGALASRLVDRDVGLYRRLLGMAALQPFHLEPLGGFPNDAWQALALAALEVGKEPEAVASASFASGGSYAGPGVDHWTGWDQAFARLEGSPELRETALIGRQIAQEWLRHSRQRKVEVELYGL